MADRHRKQFQEGLSTVFGLRYTAHERYVFGWTDHRALYSQPKQPPPVKAYDMSTDFLTNFVGMLIIMVPVTVIAYWLWF